MTQQDRARSRFVNCDNSLMFNDGAATENVSCSQVFERLLATVFMLHNFIILRFLYLSVSLHIKHPVSRVLNCTGCLVFPSPIDFS